MLGEAKFKARPTTPRTTSLPVVREGRLPTIPLHPPEGASLKSGWQLTNFETTGQPTQSNNRIARTRNLGGATTNTRFAAQPHAPPSPAPCKSDACKIAFSFAYSTLPHRCVSGRRFLHIRRLAW